MGFQAYLLAKVSLVRPKVQNYNCNSERSQIFFLSKLKNLEKIDGLLIDEEVVDATAEAARVPQMPLGESRLTNLDHYFLGQDF